jgi:hypothetical protein
MNCFLFPQNSSNTTSEFVCESVIWTLISMLGVMQSLVVFPVALRIHVCQRANCSCVKYIEYVLYG